MLHSAALTGNEILLRKLILKEKDLIHSVDGPEQETALHIATYKQHLNICQILLENNADPSIKDVNGNNCLHKLVMAPETEFIENRRDLAHLLLNTNKLSINEKNNIGRTAFHIAAENGFINTLLILSNVDECNFSLTDKFVFLDKQIIVL